MGMGTRRNAVSGLLSFSCGGSLLAGKLHPGTGFNRVRSKLERVEWSWRNVWRGQAGLETRRG